MASRSSPLAYSLWHCSSSSGRITPPQSADGELNHSTPNIRNFNFLKDFLRNIMKASSWHDLILRKHTGSKIWALLTCAKSYPILSQWSSTAYPKVGRSHPAAAVLRPHPAAALGTYRITVDHAHGGPLLAVPAWHTFAPFNCRLGLPRLLFTF
jgi:hypothetical protein